MRPNDVMTRVALLTLAGTLALVACGKKDQAETSTPTVSRTQAQATVTDPVCGFPVEPAAAYAAEYQGETYYFCDPGCKAYFQEHAAEVLAQKPCDPVCGMEIDPASAVRVSWGPKEYFFCSQGCADTFSENPEAYALSWDPVCQTAAPMAELPVRAEWGGWPMTFCSERCRDAFMAEPGRYLYAECPLCGMVFPQAEAGARLDHEGETVFFCGAGCKARFEENPAQFFGHPYRPGGQGMEQM